MKLGMVQEMNFRRNCTSAMCCKDTTYVMGGHSDEKQTGKISEKVCTSAKNFGSCRKVGILMERLLIGKKKIVVGGDTKHVVKRSLRLECNWPMEQYYLLY